MSDNPRVADLWRELTALAETDATAAAIVAVYKDREEIALVGPQMLDLLRRYRGLCCPYRSGSVLCCPECSDTDAFLAALPAILAAL